MGALDKTEKKAVVTTSTKKPNKKRLILGFVIVILLVIGVVAYFLLKPPAEVPLRADESVPGQLSALSNSDIDELAQSDVDPNDDFSRAHAKAFALSQQGNYSEAAREYKRLVDTGKASHEVYVEYAATLYYGGDKQGGIAAMGTAIEKLKATDLSQVEKDSTLKVYDNQLQAYKEDNG
ncbi:MAG TPA: hypothetical protein PLN95_04035 [Candidatus Saccharibacteria bacterium]|nr:hypothetical protein [Candidatus Saccharibacteria bacterium]